MIEPLPEGRNLGSKTGYHSRFPGHKVCFNANIFDSTGQKVWWGDLDLTMDAPSLQLMANQLDTKLFVLRESDGRFLNGVMPKLNRAVEVFMPAYP